MKTTCIRNFLLVVLAAIVVLAFFALKVQAANIYAQQPVYENEAGQRVLDVTYSNTGSLALRVFGRGGNVYVSTYNLLITTNCKGPDYYCVAYDTSNNELVILWVDTAGVLWRTPANRIQNESKGIFSGGVLNTVTSSVTGGSSSTGNYNSGNTTTTTTYSTGYNAGYSQGYNDGRNGNSYNATTYSSDYNYSSGYAAGYAAGYSQGSQMNYIDNDNNSDKVTKNGSYYRVTVDGETYEYRLSGDTLTYRGTEISDEVDELAFTDEYIIYFVGDEAYALEIGRKSSGDKILDNIEKVYYQSNGFLNYIRADGEKYYDNDVEDLIENYDDKDDDEYPYVRKSSDKYTYYKSSSRKYSYEYDEDIVMYNDNEVVDEDDEIIEDIKALAFSEGGYLYLLTEDGNLYQLKVGRDEAEKVDSNIDRMRVSSYIVTYVYDEDDDRIDIEDYE